MSVACGLDVLIAERFRRLAGRRVGVICNPTAVDARMIHLADHLAAAPGVELVALFGPEHGVRGEAQDMIGVESGVDARTNVSVYSLYGSTVASLEPTADQLAGLDLIVFDIQDVGSRYYTFAATMRHAMIAAARNGLGFLVLDRPNPIGGTIIEGPTVQPGYESFVGAHPLPIRHGLTVGELAHLFRSELALDLELEVVPSTGWRRDMLWDETGLPWVSPSPNMPGPLTALVYPGGCLLEGTNLSEGRGTTRPFELWGAPWLEAYALADDFRGHEAIHPRPCSFRPMFHKHAGLVCEGVQIHPRPGASLRSTSLYAALISRARSQRPDHFAWRTEPYEFVRDPIAIDLLFGSDAERRLIEDGEPDRHERPWLVFENLWKDHEAAFAERRRPFLLYP